MRKLFCSSLLLMAVTSFLCPSMAKAEDVIVGTEEYTDLFDKTFDTSVAANTIPLGWTLCNEGEMREGGTSFYSGPRVMDTPNCDFKRVLYVRSYGGLSYAQYGHKEGNTMEVPAGEMSVETYYAAWNGVGSQFTISVIDADDETIVAERTITTTESAHFSNSANTTVTLASESVAFTSDGGNYIFKASLTSGHIVLGGFKVNGLYRNFDRVMEEMFDDGDNSVPAAGSGWEFYRDGNILQKGLVQSWGINRIFNTPNVLGLTSGFYAIGDTKGDTNYAIYGKKGDGEPMLSLTPGKYVFTYYGIGWKNDDVQLYCKLISADGKVVLNRVDVLESNIGGDKNAAGEATKVQFNLDVRTTGDYMLKFHMSDEAIVGNITIDRLKAYNYNERIFFEDFAAYNNITPTAGSGWNLYDNSVLLSKGEDGQRSRILLMSNADNLPAAYFCRTYNYPNTYAIYGEETEGEPVLTLQPGKYELSYSCANWNSSSALKMFGQVLDADYNVIAERNDNMTSNFANSASSEVTPDNFSLTFEIKTAGNYMLKFFSNGLAVVGNIAIDLLENYDTDLEAIFIESFEAEEHNFTPTLGRGWHLYDNGVLLSQGVSGGWPNSSSRIMKLSATNMLSAGYYCRIMGNYTEPTYAIYGEGGDDEPLLILEKGAYKITFHAINWNNASTQLAYCQILDAEDNVVGEKCIDVNANLAGNVSTSATAIEGSFDVNIPSTGNYKLKIYGNGELLIGNISIDRKLVKSVKIGTNGYSTLYLGKAVVIPSGVKAYTGELNGDYLNLTELSGTVPANTGVVLMGEEGETAKFYLSAQNPAAVEGNALTGCLIATERETYLAANCPGGSIYALATIDEETAFYTYTGTNLPANKAFLALPAAQNAPKVRIMQGETAIEQMGQDNQPNQQEIYNLQGQKVERISMPGLYIVGGRKILVK